MIVTITVMCILLMRLIVNALDWFISAITSGSNFICSEFKLFFVYSY